MSAIPKQDDGCLYWKFDNDVDSDTCKKIISIAENKWQTATTKNVVKNKRKTKVHWTTEQWLYDLVFEYMHAANKNAGWNFEIDGAESMQIGRYGKGCFYNTHNDGDGTTLYNYPDNKWIHKKTRKLSMSILLNDDYEGGGFKFAGDIDNPIGGNGTKGTVIVFPSYHSHSVEKVTKGIRYSLVVWFLGKGFK